MVSLNARSADRRRLARSAIGKVERNAGGNILSPHPAFRCGFLLN